MEIVPIFLLKLKFSYKFLSIIGHTVEYKILLLNLPTPGLFPLNTTFMLHVAVFPFDVFAVIIAVPEALAVTLPVLSTCAILLLLEVHVTVLLFVLLLIIVAKSLHVFLYCTPFILALFITAKSWLVIFNFIEFVYMKDIIFLTLE